MLTKFNSEHAVDNYVDLQKALWWCIQAKNACSLKGGFAPEVLVLGKHTRLPGSVSSDNFLPAHLLAESEHAQGIKFRQQLAYRETARRAFHSADNDSALRRAMLRRSHPQRGAYQPGEWVMAWKEGLGQTQGYWQGPMKVVVHENQQTIWVTMSSKLYRCAPEHVRPVTADEAKGILQRPTEPSISEIAQQLPSEVSGTVTRYVNLGIPVPMRFTDPNMPATEEPHPHNSNTSQEDQPDNEPEVPSSAISEQEREPSEEQQVPEDPKDVPVPIETDDDLICEGLHSIDAEINVLEHTQEDLAWKAEVLVTDADIQEWKLADLPQEMSFLVSAAKRDQTVCSDTLWERGICRRQGERSCKLVENRHSPKNVSQSNPTGASVEVSMDSHMETHRRKRSGPQETSKDVQSESSISSIGLFGSKDHRGSTWFTNTESTFQNAVAPADCFNVLGFKIIRH